MSSRSFAETIERLCESSRRNYENPYEAIVWPDSVDRPAWFTSPELSTAYGTPVWDSLTEEQRQELSFWEAVNFYSLNIHGEKQLMEGVARRLYHRDLRAVTPYLHHLLDEENKHSVYFGGFCERYAGKVYASRKIGVPREYEPGEETFLFFAMVLAFEETVDRANVIMAKDERLAPLARQINASHHADEARHLIFGRRMVAELWQRWSPSWSPSTVDRVRAHIADYFATMWRDYYNPQVYVDAGVPGGRSLAAGLWAAPAQREHRGRLSARAIEQFKEEGVLVEVPVL